MSTRDSHERAPADAEIQAENKAEKKVLSVEELEERVAPSTIQKKSPVPPPYAPGTDYGLVRRGNLTW